MKKIIVMSALLLSSFSVGSAFADGNACKFSDVAKLKDHLEKHINYPATGKAIKAACLKEAPDEFTPTERACCGKHLKDGVEYKTAADVEKALGV
jgi:hypothetical protein